MARVGALFPARISGRIPIVLPSPTRNTLSRPRFFFSPSEWAFLILLALLAFIPRLILALRLDISTDEPIYMANLATDGLQILAVTMTDAQCITDGGKIFLCSEQIIVVIGLFQ